MKPYLPILIVVAMMAGPALAQRDKALSPDPIAWVSPSRDFDALHVRVDLDLDVENGRIEGSVTHTVRALKPDVRRVRLNCVGLEILAATIDGRPLDFDYPVPSESGTSWFDGTYTRESTDELIVHLPAPVPRDGQFDLTVTYRGAPVEGLYFIRPEKGIPEKRYEVWAQGEGEDSRHWIPCFDYPNDKATYEGIYRVPKGMTVMSNGTLLEKKDIGDKTQFHWKLSTPQVFYLITVAASDYKVVEESWNGIPLFYLVPPGTDDATVQRAYGLTPDMMAFFSDYIGIDYPFDKYAQITVQNFIYGGMENTGATVMNTRLLYDEHQEVTETEHDLVAHELAHMWWGDMVTCAEWSHVWLNEGFATYYQRLYRRHHEGDDAFRYEMDGSHRKTVAKDDKDARPMAVDFYNRRDERNSSNVYDRGASVLHMLHFLLGEELFRQTIQNYGERFKYDLAETSDLVRVIRETTGENLAWFFEQWVYLTGHPKLEVTKSWDDRGTLRLSIRQTQTVDKLTPLFRLPMDVEITCRESTETHRVVVENAEQDFFFDVPSEPLMVIVDKGDWTLKALEFKKTAKELIYQLRNGDMMARVRAARSMARFKENDRVVDALRDVVLSPIEFWGLRHEAALALGKIGSQEAERVLLEAIEVPEARVRKAAAMAMGSLDTSGRLDDALRAVVRDDFAYQVRAAAVTALVKMRSRRAQEICLEALKMPSHEGVIRNAALTGLVDLEATAALDKVMELARPGNRRFYRHQAIKTCAGLAKLCDNERDRRDAARFLAGMLDDWYLRTRREVITALGTLGEASAVDDLRRAASRDPVESNRKLATETADKIESKKDEVATQKELESEIKNLTDKIESLQKELDALHAGASSDDPEPLSRRKSEEDGGSRQGDDD